MMTNGPIAIMQPYFFPYLGYFQLLRAVRHFVVYDNVQYIKGGWVNRNRILVGTAPHWLTFPAVSAPVETWISDRVYQADTPAVNAVLNSVTNAYRKAPQFALAMPVIEEILHFPDPNVATFNTNLISTLAQWLAIDCEISRASAIEHDTALRGQDRILAMCVALGASSYINPIGGTELYDRAGFAQRGIDLHFLKPGLPPYAQLGGGEFVSGLSIIDLMMNCPREAIQAMLDHYELV